MESFRDEPQAALPSRRALVIGYGSPIRGDDAIGPMVADRLERRELPHGVAVVSRHILTPDLVPTVCDAELVVFVDASITGTPGEIHSRRINPAPAPPVTVAHFLDPGELLAWAAALYDKHPPAFLVSTPGHCFDFGHFRLSAPVAGALDALANRVYDLVAGPLPAPY